jgi:uncharacterized protein YndB with AHSA1/START domain
MPSQKDLKRLVRARMRKTGESYTSARARIVSSSHRPIVSSSDRLIVSSSHRSDPEPSRDFAKLAGMSNAAVKAKTGCTWERWVWALDASGAADLSHRAIAEMVHNTFKVQDWWAQTVTVGYERIKGLRQIGQRRTGEYEATRSKTFAVPVERLFQAFAHARMRAKWLPGIKVTVRKATPHRSVRMTWDDATSVEVWLIAKGESRSSAQVQHRKLSSREDAERRKAFWGERLTALDATLKG